jgi:hypothetical protein
MKKLLAIISIVSVSLTSCLKDTPNVDFSTLGTIIEIFYHDSGGNAHGGLDNFTHDALLFSSTAPVTMQFLVNIASVNPLSKDLTVTVGIDDAKRTAYNAANPVQYTPMPANMYSFTVKTGVIKAGNRLDTFNITFYPANNDPSQSYMLPISITDAQGQTISGNFGTIYFHTLGNPLAGAYNVTGTRYNYTGVVSWNNVLPVPASYTATTNMALYSPRTAAPDNTTTVEIPFGNVGSGYNYIITLTGTNSISVDYTFDALYSNITVSAATYVAATKTIHIITHYNNALAAAGNDRIFDETFVHQ